MRDYTIGVLGVASNATLDLFGRLVKAFPAEKDWDRPRIVIDNYCTMPSRVRAILYDEKKDEVIEKMSIAMRSLVYAGADRIVVDCNTAHYFIPEVLSRVPEAKERVINIIDALGDYIISQNEIHSVGLIASEGVLDTKIYQRSYNEKGLLVHVPDKSEYYRIRNYIEAVKQDRIDDDIIKDFDKFIERMEDDYIVLGCTELPILNNAAKDRGYCKGKMMLDPLSRVIDMLVEEYKSIPNK